MKANQLGRGVFVHFAYGTNLDLRAMLGRCPGAEVLGVAALHDFRLVFQRYRLGWEGGIPNVVPAPGHQVWGVIYLLEESDLTALDEYEDVPAGYRRHLRPVQTEGGTRDAWVYELVEPGESLDPEPAVLRVIIDAGVGYGFPASYLDRLAK